MYIYIYIHIYIYMSSKPILYNVCKHGVKVRQATVALTQQDLGLAVEAELAQVLGSCTRSPAMPSAPVAFLKDPLYNETKGAPGSG